MFSRVDIKPLSIAAATAIVAGLGFGAWAGPPAHLAEPAYQGELQPIYGDDPNLARYKEIIAEQGGPGPLFLVTGYAAPPPVVEIAQDHAAIEAEIARETAAFEAQNKAWEAERAAALQALDTQAIRAVAAPVAYAQPEQLTTAEAPAEDAQIAPEARE